MADELILAGDFNRDLLQPVSNDLKSFSIDLTQLVNSPTRPNIKNPERSTLMDLIVYVHVY